MALMCLASQVGVMFAFLSISGTYFSLLTTTSLNAYDIKHIYFACDDDGQN